MKRGIRGVDVKPTDSKNTLEQLINLYIFRVFMSDPLQIPSVDDFHNLIHIPHHRRRRRKRKTLSAPKSHRRGYYHKDNQRGMGGGFHPREQNCTSHMRPLRQPGVDGKERHSGRKRGFTLSAVFSPTPLMVRASAYDLILVGWFSSARIAVRSPQKQSARKRVYQSGYHIYYQQGKFKSGRCVVAPWRTKRSVVPE